MLSGCKCEATFLWDFFECRDRFECTAGDDERAKRPAHPYLHHRIRGRGKLERDQRCAPDGKPFSARPLGNDCGPRDYQDYYKRYLWDLEEPVGNESAAAFYFVSLIASRKVKVALSGQGADEPWAGYDRHIGIKLSQMYSQIPQVVTRRILGPVVDRFGRDPRWRRGTVALDEPDILTRLVKIYSVYSSE